MRNIEGERESKRWPDEDTGIVENRFLLIVVAEIGPNIFLLFFPKVSSSKLESAGGSGIR